MSNLKPTFSGHDTFPCRSLWLKKGYEFIKNNGSFNNPDAVVMLGVGKNMVSSIRYWMKSFDMLDNEDNLTELAHKLLDDNGWDPYLEDEGTLWLLHYHLVKKSHASAYYLIFNELRRQKIEFSKENFIKFVQNRFDTKISPNTLNDDFVAFTKMYINDRSSKDKEDVIGGLLTELNLVKIIKRPKDDVFVIEDSEKRMIPDALCFYALTENETYGQSISLQTIATEINSFGVIFGVNQTGIVNKFENLMNLYENELVYKDDAGVKEIQFKTQKKSPFSILNDYYNAK
jgi:Protein of unknown function (DUF4007)